MKLIIPHLYTITGLRAGRVYLIEDPDGLTLIDAGLPDAAEKIIRQIEGQGHEASDLKRILITHPHPDHIGGLPELVEKMGAQVWASAVDSPVIEGVEADAQGRKAAVGVPVDRHLVDGESLPQVMGGLEVVAVPGHTPGHLAFWQPQQRVMFTGDAIIRFLGLSKPPARFTLDMAGTIGSIGRMAELDPEVVCFGHGYPLKRKAAEAMRRFASKIGG